MLGKFKSLINRNETESINRFPSKAFFAQIEGAGGSDPTVTKDYNSASVVRQGAGIYRATLTQETFEGINLIDNSLPFLSWNIAATGTTDVYQCNISAVSSTQFDINVFEITQGGGSDLVATAYDIIAGDLVNIGLFLNVNRGLPRP